MLHPLGSASVVTLARLLARYGCDARFMPWLVPIALTSLMRQPLAWLDALRHGTAISRQKIDPPPIFILGHWRSGTTHLQNLMSEDPQFARVTLAQAAMPREFLSIPARMVSSLQRALPQTRLMDNVPVAPDVPWEEEMALTSYGPYSFYHVSFFPRAIERIFREAVMFEGGADAAARWQRQYLNFLRKVQMTQPGRPLLLKNPANTARLSLLRQMFPGARFLHIHRDPYRVFASTVHLYLKTQSAWGLQAVDRAQIVEHVLTSYPVLMEAYFKQSADLAQSDLAQVRFQDLQRAPLETMRSVYDRLSISGYDAAEPFFARYLEAQRDYRKNTLPISDNEKAQVAERWGSIFQRLGYPV